MKKMSKGTYSYRIEMDIVCNSRGVIEHIISDLTEKLEYFDQYYSYFMATGKKGIDMNKYLKSNVKLFQVYKSAYTNMIDIFL